MTTTAPKTAAATTTEATKSLADRARPIVLALFRAVVSFLFLCHGLMGFGLFGGIDNAGGAVPFGQWPGYWATLIEVVGALFVFAGLFTRVFATVLSGVMAYAYFTVHAPEGLLPLHNMGEPAALYAWVFLVIAVVGPGAAALDGLRRR
ncbi:DoxX family protein [Amycolatopsis rubida]|uniref:DoxX family protein n=1 Tax=Amycolatopsis rubida TaxID=112413 RepID=A0A1I5IE18_9PSEU|nr:MULTISPECIES: DoxX family protein [Amycolatopsis]MYW96835.1 DoxX family membrane protein [Amycolatopsis rubida]NEC61820.1 DoxX family protein [Amycolatopsis rubida]OAP25694.1 DoxX [Amycolatopsis sp. M39]SFO58888.1 putative oxidoreductase [Amycolatopsis rubida]